MRAIRILGMTRYLGAPPGWKDEGKPCGFLAICDEVTSLGPTMTSAWELEPHELAMLAEGGTVYLTVCGQVHPPVALRVGKLLEEPEGG